MASLKECNMITYEHIEVFEIRSVVCDICQKEFESDMELQEFHYIDFIGGYGSVFGDGSCIRCDICQYCLKELIGKYIQKDE